MTSFCGSDNDEDDKVWHAAWDECARPELTDSGKDLFADGAKWGSDRALAILREEIDKEVTRWHMVATNPKTELEDVEFAEGRAAYLLDLLPDIVKEITGVEST